MPSLQGYEVCTHSLPGRREIDVLHRPGDVRRLWTPGQQVAALSGDGLRATGFYSTSDIAKTIDPVYSRREPDPHRLYSRSRVRYTTLFSVAGLIQRTFHTDNPGYVEFCQDFITHVLPAYADFGTHNAELISVWQVAIKYHMKYGRRPLTGFYAAINKQAERLAASSSDRPASERETTKPGPTTEEMQDAFRRIKEELLTSIEPIVGRAVRAHSDQAHQATVIKLMSEQVEQIVQMTLVNREQLELSRHSNELAQKSIELSRQSIDLITPSHQLFLPASDYIKMDGVEEALRRAPRLARPSFGLDHCPDLGKASLWMKRLCRAEDKKVAANAVARIIAKDAGQEEPPLYIPEFRWKRLTREHVKLLMFNPACWARLKQTFLPPDTPTLLFPGPKTQPAPETGKTEKTEKA